MVVVTTVVVAVVEGLVDMRKAWDHWAVENLKRHVRERQHPCSQDTHLAEGCRNSVVDNCGAALRLHHIHMVADQVVRKRAGAAPSKTPALLHNLDEL